jgi:hypothetical protein
MLMPPNTPQYSAILANGLFFYRQCRAKCRVLERYKSDRFPFAENRVSSCWQHLTFALVSISVPLLFWTSLQCRAKNLARRSTYRATVVTMVPVQRCTRYSQILMAAPIPCRAKVHQCSSNHYRHAMDDGSSALKL